jgi:hypothetical protein
MRTRPNAKTPTACFQRSSKTVPTAGGNLGSNLQYMDNNIRRNLIADWKQARTSGQSQKDFCKEHGITDRTLRAWLAAEGKPRVSARQAEVVLRRLGLHILQVAEKFSASQLEMPSMENPEPAPSPTGSPFDCFDEKPDSESSS